MEFLKKLSERSSAAVVLVVLIGSIVVLSLSEGPHVGRGLVLLGVIAGYLAGYLVMKLKD